MSGMSGSQPQYTAPKFVLLSLMFIAMHYMIAKTNPLTTGLSSIIMLMTAIYEATSAPEVIFFYLL